MRMKNIYTMLASTGLLHLPTSPQVVQALSLWNSGIIDHTDTLKRLGGHSPDALTHQEYRMMLSYLCDRML